MTNQQAPDIQPMRRRGTLQMLAMLAPGDAKIKSWHDGMGKWWKTRHLLHRGTEQP
jgi:hypothetical protein